MSVKQIITLAIVRHSSHTLIRVAKDNHCFGGKRKEKSFENKNIVSAKKHLDVEMSLSTQLSIL